MLDNVGLAGVLAGFEHDHRLHMLAPDGIRHANDADILFLIPVGLAISFMLWVIWALEKQIRKGR